MKASTAFMKSVKVPLSILEQKIYQFLLLQDDGIHDGNAENSSSGLIIIENIC